MGRRCLCERVDRLLRAQPWFPVLDAAAKWIAMELARRIAEAPDMRLPYSDPRRVSLSVSVSVPEAETALQTLLETGLFLRDDAGGLSCPALGDLAARTSAARENGRKGGRPRKGETPEQAAQRRQGSLLLPLAGAQAETQETHSEPRRESSRGERESSSAPSPSSPVSLDARELVALTEQLAEIAGLDPVRGGYHAGPIKAWLAAGATPELLREVVATVRARSTAEIGSFRYFDAAVREAIARPAVAPRREASDGEDSPYIKAWREYEFAGGRPGHFPSPAEWYAQHGRAA